MVLVEEQVHLSMEQNRESRNRPTHIRPTDFLTKMQNLCNGRKIVFFINGAGVIECPQAKTKTKTKQGREREL